MNMDSSGARVGLLRSSKRRVKTHDRPVWLFDLDNTLHHASHEIFPAINRGMTQYIIDRLGVDIDEARSEEHTSELQSRP